MWLQPVSSHVTCLSMPLLVRQCTPVFSRHMSKHERRKISDSVTLATEIAESKIRGI